MGNIPVISGRILIKILEKIGFSVLRQKGSHVIMKYLLDPRKQVIVPLHTTLKKGTLLSIIKQIGLSLDDLKNLLRK